MRQTSIVAALVLSVPVCLPPAADEAVLLSRQPAWVAQEPVSQPRIFAEGAISTPDDEMDATFTADGKTIYFTKTHFPNRLGVIVSAHFQNGKWSEPEVVSFSGRFTDYDPFITPDGTKLFFASNRPLTGGVKKDFDIWFVEKTPAGWGEAKNAGAVINSPQDEFYPTVANDGTLYFSTTRPDSLGRSDIYRARWKDGAFGPPENLGAGVNSPTTEVDGYIAPDQSFIVFAAYGRPDGLGDGDLYVSEQVNGVWSAARHLGAGINSPAREYCPGGSPDGKYFFFTSFRGFGDTVPDRPWTYRDLRAGIGSVLNGWGNIYQIETAALGVGKR